jgi:citronellol/citronellal dehydrogenase
MARMSRTPEVVADAAHAILTRPARECTGNFFIDEEVLREEGVTDLARYAPGVGDGPLVADFFVPEEVFARSGTRVVQAL